MAIPMPTKVSTLPKFGISHSGDSGNGPMLMPKVSYKFRIMFLGFGNATEHGRALTLNTNTCSLPNISFDVQTIHSYNSRSYFSGKHEWQPIDLVCRNTVDNSVEKAVGAQMQKQLDHYSQTSWRSASDYKFTTIIQSLNGDHQSVIDSWTLEGCFLVSANWNGLDYASSEGRTINMQIRPDNCILEEFAGGTNSMWEDPNKGPLGPYPKGIFTGT